MFSISASSSNVQVVPGPGEATTVDELLIAEGSSQDHEMDEETRSRLGEWQSMAANLQGGFTQMPDRVRKDSKLSTSAKIVYEHLLSFMRQKDRCWPSQQTIADDLGISRRTVIRACKELQKRFYIEKVRRGFCDTNVYFKNPLVFVESTGTSLAQVNLQPFDAKVPAAIAGLYGVTFYANDDLSEVCQNVTSRSDILAHPEVPESHTKHTKVNNSQLNKMSSNYSSNSEGMFLSDPPTTIRTQTTQQPNEETKTTQRPNNAQPSKPNHQPSTQAQAAAANAEAAKPPKTEQKQQGQPSAQAQAIAAVTGIPAAHLAELGIAQEPQKRPVPDFITHIMGTYTSDLGDSPRSFKSNVTRAAKLYYFSCSFIKDAQEDPEGWFTDLLRKAKAAALSIPGIRHRSQGGRLNRMPAFFTCLEKEFGFSPEELEYVRSAAPLLVL